MLASTPSPPGLDVAGDAALVSSLSAAIADGELSGRVDSSHGPMMYAAVPVTDGVVVQLISIDQRMELATLSTASYAVTGAVAIRRVASKSSRSPARTAAAAPSRRASSSSPPRASARSRNRPTMFGMPRRSVSPSMRSS